MVTSRLNNYLSFCNRLYSFGRRLPVYVIFLIFVICSCKHPSGTSYTTWQTYSGDPTGSKYSSLDQIDTANVKNLKVAWEFRTGDMSKSPPTTIECNPIVVNNIVYITSPALKLFALEASSGKKIWTFDPALYGGSAGVNRGVTYWKEGTDERIFFASASWLYCLDAGTGKLKPDFGEEGKVDLYEGLGKNVHNMWLTAPTPGIIYKDLLIMGDALSDGPENKAPGFIRAFDVRTGAIRWTFHTIPQPGEFGYDTWPQDYYLRGGAVNCWGGFTLDEKRGWVFFGTGSGTYDHWGGNRKGQNLFANCVMALDAATGKRIWHYQIVHHDVWDYDLPCQPNLVQVKKDGKLIDAVAQPTKTGMLFVLNRDTGEPVFPVKEQPVPASDIPGEETWPTQPFPPSSLIYGMQQFNKDDVTDISDSARNDILGKLKNMETGGTFLPPRMKGSVIIPQFCGGTDWGGAAYDPVSRMLYVNCCNEAEWTSMVKAAPSEKTTTFELGRMLYGTICSACHGYSNPNNPNSPSLDKLKQIRLDNSRSFIDSVLRNGKGQMPKFTSLSQTERSALVDFLGDEGKETAVNRDSMKQSFTHEILWVASGHNTIRDPEGFPANKRPWGTMSAINLDEGKIAWQVPLGTYPELEARGFPPTGTFNMGGPLVTAGGLVFIGGAMDERFRAMDAKTGKVLWQFQMDAGGYATPSTFSVNGKQYVVIAAGGGGKPETKPGDAYYCFALP